MNSAIQWILYERSKGSLEVYIQSWGDTYNEGIEKGY